jgi:fucose 4-O-acetylase-like acetyltransferase
MEKMRNATFDMLKGIGILLVIIGHTFMKEIGPYIQAFHMPLFFIVAGYFFKYKPLRIQLVRDFRRLIVPYFFVVITTMLIAFAKDFKATGEINLHLGTLYECGTPAWFLLALYGTKQIFNLLFQFSKQYYLFYAFLLSSIPCLIAHYIEINPTLAVGSSICGVFFYAVGHYVNVNQILIKSEPYKVYIVVIAILLWLNTSIFGAVDMHYCIFKLWIIDFLGACAGVYLCYALCNYIENRTVRSKNLLTTIGYYSFVIYSFHAIEYVFPDWHQIASFSDGTALRPFVIVVFRLVGACLFVLITQNVTMLKELFFPKHHVY